MPTPFLPFLPSSGDISDGAPFYYSAATSTSQNGVLSTLQAALYAEGVGVVPTATNALLVSAGTGLNYNVTAGFAVVRHSTRGPFFMVQSALSAQGPLPANRGVGNEIYLFLVAQRETFNDTAITGLGQLTVWDNNTYDGGILLATITTSASAILTVVPNVDRFNELKIHNYAEDTTPDPTDEILIWDSATGSLMKVTVANLLASNGGVTGPASSVTNAIPVYNGTTGKIIQDSTFTIDNLGGPRLITQASHGFAVGDCVYLSGSNVYAKARADALATTNPVGRVISVPTTGTFVVARNGYMTGLSSLVAGTLYYLSVSTAGTMSATLPATLGQYVRPVFYADTTTSGYILDRPATPALIGTDQIATGGQISKEQLEYIAITDVASGLAVAAATWVDIVPNQTFTIERADNRQVNVLPSGVINISTADPTGGSFALRLLFDSATTATPLPLGGAYVTAAKPENMLQGTGTPRITGLGAGSHTVKLQVKCEVAASVYLRAATKPDYENFRLRVVEGKR